MQNTLLALLVSLLFPVFGHTQTIGVPQIRPFLNSFCTGCHNDARRVGGIMLDKLNLDDVSKDAEVWEKILRELRARTMPISSGGNRPDDRAYKSAVSAIEAALDQVNVRRTQSSASNRLSDVEVVTRLAQFIWSAAPDTTLLNAARQGAMKNPAELERQIQRMLKDSKAEALGSFLKQILRLEDVGMRQDIDAKLKADFLREAELFVQYQLREDRPAMELWTADYTFANETLAGVYGMQNLRGPQFRRVSFSDSTSPDNARAGLLGQAGFLAGTSMPARTAPVIKGSWLLNEFLGVGHPAPPPNLPPPIESGPTHKLLDEAYAATGCGGCHYITRLGYGLENFDQFGRWRTTDSGSPVDASGTFPDGSRFDGAASFRTGLLKFSESFLTTLTERLYARALSRAPQGRQTVFYEMPTIRSILREAAAKEYRWSALITAIAKSTPFHSPLITPLAPPASTSTPDFAGEWIAASGRRITITQNENEIRAPRGARVWTYHLNKWGDRYEGPGGGKLVQARFDGETLIMAAGPAARAGSVLEIWRLNEARDQLTIETLNMTEVSLWFDFKESAISPVYARNRTVYRRTPPLGFAAAL